MNLTLAKILARIARRMPKTILRVRYFKHKHRPMNFNGSIDRIDTMMQYVNRAAVANKSNIRWAKFADKYAVRQEVARIIGEEYLIPLYGHWTSPDDIDFASLKTPCVLKTNNGCGTNVYIHNLDEIDTEQIKRQLRYSLEFPYPELSGQLHYSLIEPCIIAEKLMKQGGGHKSLSDYKVYCVNGEPQFINVFSDRDEVEHFEFGLQPYTPRWQKIQPGQTADDVGDSVPVAPGKPECFDRMIDFARRFAQGEEFVRVDFYIIDDHIFFGEQTYTPDVGYHAKFKPYLTLFDAMLTKIKAERLSAKSDKTF